MKRIAAGLESLSMGAAPPKKWLFLSYFVGFFSVFFVAEGVLLWVYYRDELTHSEKMRIEIAEEHLTELVGAVQSEYARYSDDVRNGAMQFELRWRQKQEGESKPSLDAQSLGGYANELRQIFPQYDSIRIVSIDGGELLHVVRNEPHSLLDNRYLFYFKAATQVLGRGQVYVSPFDLSQSAGLKIEFVSPLYNDAKLLGYLLFGIGSPAFLQRLEAIRSQDPAVELMLFNTEKQLLCVMACSSSARLSKTLSSLSRESKAVKLKDGTAVFKTVYPLRGLENVVWSGDSNKSIGVTSGGIREDYRFRAAAFIPDHLIARSVSIEHLGPIAGGTLVFLGIVAGWLAVALIRLGEERDRKQHILGLAVDLYTNSPCGYHSLDPNGTVLLMNDTELRWLGYSRDEVIGKKKYPEFLASPEQATEFMRNFNVMVGGVPPETDWRFQARRKDGSLLDIAITPNFVRDADGKFVMSRSIVNNITERVRLEAALEQEAHFDALTAIFNRGYFIKLAERQLGRAQRKNEPLSLLYLDLDHFKNINDTYGHIAGDQVLRHSCRLISESLRPGDLFGRLGGEEFAVLLPGAALFEAVAAAERIRRLVSKAPLQARPDCEIKTTISIGVAELSTHGSDLDTLLSAADRALYRAKNRGRDRVESALALALNAPISA